MSRRLVPGVIEPIKVLQESVHIRQLVTAQKAELSIDELLHSCQRTLFGDVWRPIIVESFASELNGGQYFQSSYI
jgi:hypothetical protein